MQHKMDEKLELYHGLLVKWQAKINLVSPATLGDAKTRHFADSLQLLPHIPEDAHIVYDLGSGAGFPGMVLAMARPDLEVHLVESDRKKCSFLKTVSRETDTPVFIHNERIEVVSRETDRTPDVVTARALAPLPELLDYCAPWIARNPELVIISPKGVKAEAELAAPCTYEFLCDKFTSHTDKNAQVLVLKQIRPCL